MTLQAHSDTRKGVKADSAESAIEQSHLDGRPRSAAGAEPRRRRGKILHVVCTLDLGGTETQMVQVVGKLDRIGYDVTVVCLHKGGPLRETLAEAGIKVVDYTKPPGSLISLKGIVQILSFARFIRREEFDVVHANDLWANLIAVPAGRLAGVPMVISSQRDLAHLWWYTPFRKKVIQKIHKWAHCVIANSVAVRQMLQEEFHIPEEHVRVIHNGVDLTRFDGARDSRQKLFPDFDPQWKLIVTVANMHSAVKGHYELIEAARIVRDSIPEARFLLVGDGEERLKLEEAVRSAGMQDRIVFLNSRSDVSEVLSCCDLFVLPSRAEGLPNALLEALAAGLPVIATAVGGVPDIIEDGVNGVLIPPQNPAALADALLRVLKNPRLSEKLGRGGRDRVRTNFSFDHTISELRRIYSV